MVSNVVASPKISFGPTSTRSVRVLGSTSTTTVCNSHTTGNIVVIAAGGNAGNPVGIGMDMGRALR